jgi:hypothetical protein
VHHLGEKDVLKNNFMSRLFPSKKPLGKLCAFKANLRNIGKKSASSAAIQNVKEQFQTDH